MERPIFRFFFTASFFKVILLSRRSGEPQAQGGGKTLRRRGHNNRIITHPAGNFILKFGNISKNCRKTAGENRRRRITGRRAGTLKPKELVA